MLKIYITNIDGADFRSAAEGLSEYRRKKNSAQSAAAGLLLDYALRGMGLCERDMEYETNIHGKPFFKNRRDIKFSLSHSGNLALCAVSDGEVGVDAERIRQNAEIYKIAARYFTDAEYSYIKNAADEKRAFFRLWTRKESLLKAIGTGLSGGLKNYEVLCDSVSGTGFVFTDIELENAAASVCAEEKAGVIEFADAQKLTELGRDT